MTFTSMIKELVLPVSGEDNLEAAIVAQVATYIPNTYQIFDLSCYAESGELCVVGNIGSTDTDDNYTVPFYAVNTAGQDVANPTWVVSALGYDLGVSFTLQEENAGLYSLVEIPSTSTNWGKGWVAVGMTGDKKMVLEFSPVIVHIGIDGILTDYASSTGTFPPDTWEFTDTGGVPSDEQPYALCDLVYDKMNDAIVAVGSIGGGIGSLFTFTMVVEAISLALAPTLIFSTQYGIADVAPYSAFGKSCAIQTQDPSGAEVANRTIVSICGFSQDSTNIGNTAYGTWALYQPNFSNPFGGVGFNPRQIWLATGKNRPADYWDASGLFPSNDDRPNYLNIIERLTADGEDIYFLGGNCPQGLFGYTISGLTTDSTGGGNDNIINTAGAGQTIVNFAEQKIVSSNLQLNTVLNGAQIPNATDYYPTDILAIGKNNGNSGRRTKVYSIGGLAYGRFCPFPVVPNLPNLPADTWIFAVSRGFKLFQEDISEKAQQSGLLGNVRSKTLAICPRTDSEKTRIIFSQASFNPIGAARPSTLVDVAVATGNASYAWFEYLLYDGVDALIARKLNEMGVRVTIANVEWYKQDILKQGLDVSTDFFNEWGELQIEENKQRERVAEQFGRKRSPKRQVRTELFDDYADYEDKESQIKEFPDYDPAKDGDPFKDDVALEQEVAKTQKAVDDLRRIEDLVEDETNDEAEYDDEADVSDWGEN